ncbi:MAG: histidine phosphatase family protein [Rhodospirillum sp.]|nr:histidine phosphatase family protein [Rhodospirillum sp.]MCF8488676.1 histidine phosphatase family protein [Rhodospirillum sp.]MCF8502562.1 histidine phosphatase family protein [Rhodospirillum sp.]
MIGDRTGESAGPVTRWWWVRHAPVPDSQGRIQGRMDLPCDTGDEEEIAALGGRLPPGAALVLTPLSRTHQTAHALEMAGARLDPFEEEEAFLEQDFGRWQGKTWGGLASQDPPDPDLEAFWRDPGLGTPPGGESFVRVMDRVARAVLDWSDRLGDRDVVVVAHAGAIRAAVAQALELSPAAALRLSVEPLSLTRIDRFAAPDSGWALRSLNETYW